MAETETWAEESFGSGALAFCLQLLSRFSPAGSRVSSPAVRPDSDGARAAGSHQPQLRPLEDASEILGERVQDVRALALIGLDGGIKDRIVLDQAISPEILSEFGTLVRIADRTSRDSVRGGLSESTWSTEGGTVLSRRVDEERFLLLVGGPALQASLGRYVLRQAARRILGPKSASA